MTCVDDSEGAGSGCELSLENALTKEPAQLPLILQDQSLAYSTSARADLLAPRHATANWLQSLNRVYTGRCQLCGFDSPTVYSVDSAESHHIWYRSRGGPDTMENLALLCPNHHTVIHATDATFDYANAPSAWPNSATNCHGPPTSGRA